MFCKYDFSSEQQPAQCEHGQLWRKLQLKVKLVIVITGYSYYNRHAAIVYRFPYHYTAKKLIPLSSMFCKSVSSSERQSSLLNDNLHFTNNRQSSLLHVPK